MTGWTVIVPVKPWSLAKSRMRLPGRVRHDLARAFALDVLDIVTRTPSVGRIVVVTAERELRVLAQHHGAHVITDRPLMTLDPLTTAIGLARSWARARAAVDPIVVVPADLPALTVDTFEAAMASLSEAGTGFVADMESTGTTLFAARSPDMLRPAYGRGSARRHRALGVREAIGIDSRVRFDVDTVSDLLAVSHLGMGPRTTVVASGLSSHVLRYPRGDDEAMLA